MRGFEAGDEIDFWPTWRSDIGKAPRLRATLVDWDEHGMTVRLDQDYRKMTFLPWVQVRLLQKVALPRPAGGGATAAFRWTKPAEDSTNPPILGHQAAEDPKDG